MRYLLDSDILIDFLAGNESIKDSVDGFMSDGVAISVISYLEALQGFFKLDDMEESITDFSRQLGYIAIVAVNLNVGQTCARIRYDLARAKRSFRNRSLDLLIAATAIEYGFTLVTRNTKHFDDIPGLQMVNL
jgi:predicted nucleic acid-binding protein